MNAAKIDKLGDFRIIGKGFCYKFKCNIYNSFKNRLNFMPRFKFNTKHLQQRKF